MATYTNKQMALKMAIEMHLDPKGVGEGKTSLGANVAIDAAANTLALDGYAAAPAQLRITR